MSVDPAAASAAALLAASGAASDTAGPDMAAPAITPDDVARGTELLRRYKDGKRAFEAEAEAKAGTENATGQA